jgi:hypothetical protein
METTAIRFDGSGRTVAVSDYTGEFYITVLERLHRLLEPCTYLEIGTDTGESLRVASCDTLAIDTAFRITGTAIGSKHRCLLFQMPSDRFFKTYDVRQLLGAPVDLAFLDGMHLSEFLLRDFINVERACRPNSVVALHDCMPTDVYIAERVDDRARRDALSTRPDWWTGDVWKVVVALKTYRPDLVIHALDAAPTGLVLVTNLNPESDTLVANYQTIIENFRSLDLIEYGLDRYQGELCVISTSEFVTFEKVHSHFWL